jgi:uncharacterized protein
MHSEIIVDFCRFLRNRGFNAGVLDTLGAIEVAHTVKRAGIAAVQHGLRASLCSSKEEWDAFDDLFETWMAGGPDQKPSMPHPPQARPAFLVLNGSSRSSDRELERDGKAVSGASAYERLSKTDLGEVSYEDQAVLERLAQRLFKRACLRWSRRLKIAETRAALDFRRTIRRSIGRGGEILDLRFKGKKPKKPRLVILLDVSGSMNPYSLFLLRFAHALQRQFSRTLTFLFSTRLVQVTAELRSHTMTDVLKMLPAMGVSWSGGTMIGKSLEMFNALCARKSLSRDTLFIILSDGWDTGDPTHLASQLGAIKKKVRKLIWLNPLLGLEEYRPLTRAMGAALPYIDVFAPAHSLESLTQLQKHICSTNS